MNDIQYDDDMCEVDDNYRLQFENNED